MRLNTRKSVVLPSLTRCCKIDSEIMELLLNVAWALLAIAMACLWLCFAPRGAGNRRVQLIALAVVILILLPAISMTDDLLAAQNPAETDSYLRRDQEHSRPHSTFSPVSNVPSPAFAGLSWSHPHLSAPANLPAPTVASPSLSSIQDRPPPAA
jgi:hypothetical protein